ncbi:MAG: YfcC family protein, partial [Pseudoalteromonas shioyasakiensis]
MGLRFKVPHTLILLLGMMVVALIATWLVPQGFFTTTLSESGREMVVAG